MNKSELVDALATEAGITKNDAAAVVDAVFGADGGIIASTLRRGERVQITGFGTFEVRSRDARDGRNPRTGEVIRIPASKAPAFKAGKSLKDAI